MFTILCPTDFSQTSLNAINYAAEIASNLNGRLHLTHLVYPPYTGGGEGSFVIDVGLEELIANANLELDKLAQQLRKQALEVSISTEFGFWDVILKNLEGNIKPDLVVSGTNGSSSVFSAKLLGMNTMTMIRKMACPVLAVPPGFRFSKLDSIVYATDYQFEDIDHAVLVERIAQIQHAKIHFVHVATKEDYVEKDRDYMAWFKELIDKQIKYPFKEFSVIVDQKVEEALEFYAFNENVDLLCVAMRERSALGQIFGHSHTQKFLVDARIPVLVFHLSEDFKM